MGTVDTMAVDTDTVDTMDTTEARGLPMPNPRPKLLLLPPLKPKPKPTLTTDTDITVILTDTDTMAILTVTSARDPLMLNPSLTTDTDTTVILTDTDTATADSDIMVEPLLKQTLKLLSGSSHSISFNLATTKIPSF